MGKINLIGSSNLKTNQTCVFGSMAGLAPTATVRPHVTGLHGYKFLRSAANGIVWSSGKQTTQSSNDRADGCGLGKWPLQTACSEGKKCIKAIGHSSYGVSYRTGGKYLS
tara:strand:- start:343 stop:672 length:330 start_codon:yes stop_codon:yes gene_type:complete